MTVLQKSQNGFALVIVIWILTLLSLMAGSFTLTMRRESSVTAALKNNAQALALTETGLALAKYMLLQANPEERWLTDGTPYQIMRADGSEIRVSLVSESGKVDINTANENLLSAVIKAVTNDTWEQQHLLNCILDWRDADDDLRPHGAEKKQYVEAGLSYLPANKPFQTLDELRMVLDMDDAVFAHMQPWLTVYSGQADVNLQEATPELLDIINNDLLERNIQDAGVQKQIAGQAPTSTNPVGNGEAANTQNGTYTIIVEVRMADGAAAALESVIRMQSQDPGQANQVLDWKPNQLTQSLYNNDMDSRLIAVQNELTDNN